MKTQGDTDTPENEVVRCNSCRAVISGIVSRCPYCGQRTTGAEQKVTQYEISQSARIKASERRLRSQCKVCGKPTLPDTPLCEKCEAKDRLRRKIIVGSAIIVLIVCYLIFLRSL